MTQQQSTSTLPSDQRVDDSRKTKPRLRTALLVLCIFVGGGALFGGVMVWISPDFMGAPLLVPILQQIPLVGPHISSLAIPGTALLLFVFVPHAIAVILLLRKHPKRFIGAVVCGAFLVAFTTGEMIFMPNAVSILFLLFGVAEIALAVTSRTWSK